MIEAGGFALFFVTIVVGVLLILALALFAFSRLFSRASGWDELAARYAATHQPDGQTFNHRHSRVGLVRYRNCSTIGVSPSGLYLAVAAPVISHHPPLLIPWSEVTSAQPTRVYWLSAMQLSVGRPHITTIAVMKDVYDAMRPYLRWVA